MAILKGILRSSVAVLIFSVSIASQAAPLNLTPQNPDFGLSTLAYNYTAPCAASSSCTTGDQGTLTINGIISGYTEDPAGAILNNKVFNSAFFLTATFDIFSETVVSGNFFIDGEVKEAFVGPPIGIPTIYDGFSHTTTGHLLSGDLGAFGFAGNGTGGGLIEFTFLNANGYIADPLYPLLELGAFTAGGGGIILSAATTLANGTFNSNLLTQNWTGSGSGDAFIPVPAAVWLFGSGLIMLFGIGRVKRF